MLAEYGGPHVQSQLLRRFSTEDCEFEEASATVTLYLTIKEEPGWGM